MWSAILVVLTISSFSLVESQGITIAGVKCGVKTCQLSEYCSSFDRTCQPCADVCDTNHHNYEQSVCEKQCQDYLHDIRYQRKPNRDDKDEDLRGTVSRLSRMVTVTLTLVCLMLIVLASFLCFQLYRWKDKKNITLRSLKQKFFKNTQSPENTAKTNSSNAENKKSDLRLDIPDSGTISEHSPVTMTTSISRRPAEDSTLDYAYDNPVMSKSH